jgi:transcriptional regulator with XRE-family HTH domain
MEIGKIIGNNLKDYRLKYAYSQEYIAKYLGVDTSIISRYETADREISIVHLNKLADIYGVELEDLIEPEAVKKTVNMAFAYRSQGIDEQDLKSIGAFQKVVKNYLKMIKIAKGEE